MIREGQAVPLKPLNRAIRYVLMAGGVGGTVLLAGCMDQGDRFVSADEAELGDVVSGELKSGSEVNLKDGSRQGRHWVCSGDDAAGVLYQLDAPFLGHLSLFDDQGNWLGAANATLESEASLLLSGTDECVLVVVSGGNRKDFGPYSLKPQSTPAAKELADGNTVSGVADDEEIVYGFTIEEASGVSLRLSGGGDAALGLTGAGITARPSRCGSHQQVMNAYLEAGDYQAVVAPGARQSLPADTSCQQTFASTGNGYRLSMDLSGLASGERNAGPLRNGDRITGTLTHAGASNSYTLDIDTPTHVTLRIVSTEFDPVLNVNGGDTSIEIDDTGDDTNPTLDQVLMPGHYRVAVSGYEDEHGPYSVKLTTNAFEGEFRNSGELIHGESLHGMADGTEPYVYTLSLEQPADVTLSAFSSSFDTLLALDGMGTSITDDDSAGDTNSRISTMLVPGDYRVELTSYAGGASGAFRLETAVAPYDGEILQGCDTLQDERCEIEPGTTVLEELRDGSQTYQFVLDEPADVVISMNSTAFDTMLGLEGPDVDLTDDDGGADTNARISTRLQAGQYRIRANSYEGNGPYVLKLEATLLQ